MSDTVVLTPEQEKIVRDACLVPNANPSITELVRLIFPNAEDIDGRAKEGRAIKAFITSDPQLTSIKLRTTADYIPKERLVLTENNKEFIGNNLRMTPVELARAIYGNPRLTNLNIETRTVAEYIQTLRPANPDIPENDVPESVYRPPKTVAGVLQRVEKYV